MVASALKSRGQFTGVRPINVARDLGAVAEVLELAFADDLDAAQQAILRDMKRMRFFGPLLWLFGQVAPEFDPLMPGFVWIERGRLVGNVTVTRLRPDSRYWLISNLAVHPDFRRRGIGRRLMAAALDLVESHGGSLVTLEVRHDNVAAQALYRGLGFEPLCATVHLRLDQMGGTAESMGREIGLRPVRSREWHKVYDLARAATPGAVQRIMPVRQGPFEMTFDRRLGQWIEGVVRGCPFRRWAVERGGRFVAVLSLRPGHIREVCQMGLLIHPEWRGRLEDALMAQALEALSRMRFGLHRRRGAWALEAHLPDYLPEAIEALKHTGFVTVRTEDRLVLDLRE